MITITISTYFGRNMNMNWYPKKKDGKPLSEKDVRSVIHYISYGEWEMPVSSAARNAYKELANCVAKQLVDDIRGDYAKFKEVCMPVYVAYLHNELSPNNAERFRQFEEYSKNKASYPYKKDWFKMFMDIIASEELFVLRIKNGNESEDDTMRCCICGKEITDDEGHDPYPVRPESFYGEKENRCCPMCNAQIVIPVRMGYGRDAAQHQKQLRKMGHEELIEFVA